MELEILVDDGQVLSGEFAVASISGADADQTGTFEGAVSGNTLNATADLEDGTSIQLTGTISESGLKLTRSDIPGTVLDFTPVTPSNAAKTRADVSFNLNVVGTSGRCVISDQPYSVQGVLTEYRGTWQGLKTTFWAYSSGYANITINVNDYAIESINLSNYRLSDFTTVTKASSSGYMNVYSPVTKVILKFGSTATVSP